MTTAEPPPESLFAGTIILSILASGAVLTRLWLIRRRERDIHGFISEIIYGLALPLFLATSGLIASILHKQVKGLKEIERVGLGEFMRKEELRKELFYVELLYRINLWFLKWAYITFLWGIFARAKSRLRWVIYLTFILSVMTFFAVIAVMFVGCQPIERHWTIDYDELKPCRRFDISQNIKVMTFSNIAIDVFITACALLLLHSTDTSLFTLTDKLLLGPILLLLLTPAILAAIRHTFLHKQGPFLAPFPLLASLPTFLQTLECAIFFLPLFLLSFRPGIEAPNDSKKDWTASLIRPDLPPQGLERRRRTFTLGIGQRNEFAQKRYDLDAPDVVEIGDAVPGVDYKIYPLSPTSPHSPSSPRKLKQFPISQPAPTIPSPPSPIIPYPTIAPPPSPPRSNPSRSSSRSQFEKIRHRIESEGLRDFTFSEARSVSRVTNPESLASAPGMTRLAPRPRTPPGLRGGWRTQGQAGTVGADRRSTGSGSGTVRAETSASGRTEGFSDVASAGTSVGRVSR